MTTATVTAYACERCRGPVPPDGLVCPNCGALVYRRQLEGLSGEAMRIEAVNPPAAAMVWRRCLDLLPPDSRQYRMIYDRIGALASGMGFAPGGYAPGGGYVPADGGYAGPFPVDGGPGGGNGHPQPHAAARRVRPPDPWPLAVAKTGGSMLLSMLAYTLLYPGTVAHRFAFAFGFVLLVLIHELGHSFATRHYRLSASPPIFIPFLGALINMRQPPPDAKVEAVVGIAGPVLGTVGVLGCFALYLGLPADHAYKSVLLTLSFLGFTLNFFNLLPIPPLDGGRVTAAISPWIWVLGVVGIVALILKGIIGPIIGALVLSSALPRVIRTLQARGRLGEYYNIGSRAAWTIGTAYVSLGVLLAAGFFYTKALARASGAWPF